MYIGSIFAFVFFYNKYIETESKMVVTEERENWGVVV